MKEESMKEFFKWQLISILMNIGLFMLVFYPAISGHYYLASCLLGGECGLLGHFIRKSINN